MEGGVGSCWQRVVVFCGFELLALVGLLAFVDLGCCLMDVDLGGWLEVLGLGH